MKTRFATLLTTGIAMLILAQFGGWAQNKYVPKENEELFGRWKDVKAADMQTVFDSVGFKTYYGSTNNVVLNEATLEIDKKWTDAQGNIWYRALGLCVGQSPYVGTKFQALYEVDTSKTELKCKLNTVNEYDPSNYPTENGSEATNEYSFHRVEK
jgi:hypothetical protein